MQTHYADVLFGTLNLVSGHTPRSSTSANFNSEENLLDLAHNEFLSQTAGSSPFSDGSSFVVINNPSLSGDGSIASPASWVDIDSAESLSGTEGCSPVASHHPGALPTASYKRYAGQISHTTGPQNPHEPCQQLYMNTPSKLQPSRHIPASKKAKIQRRPGVTEHFFTPNESWDEFQSLPHKSRSTQQSSAATTPGSSRYSRSLISSQQSVTFLNTSQSEFSQVPSSGVLQATRTIRSQASSSGVSSSNASNYSDQLGEPSLQVTPEPAYRSLEVSIALEETVPLAEGSKELNGDVVGNSGELGDSWNSISFHQLSEAPPSQWQVDSYHIPLILGLFGPIPMPGAQSRDQLSWVTRNENQTSATTLHSTASTSSNFYFSAGNALNDNTTSPSRHMLTQNARTPANIPVIDKEAFTPVTRRQGPSPGTTITNTDNQLQNNVYAVPQSHTPLPGDSVGPSTFLQPLQGGRAPSLILQPSMDPPHDHEDNYIFQLQNQAVYEHGESDQNQSEPFPVGSLLTDSTQPQYNLPYSHLQNNSLQFEQQHLYIHNSQDQPPNKQCYEGYPHHQLPTVIYNTPPQPYASGPGVQDLQPWSSSYASHSLALVSQASHSTQPPILEPVRLSQLQPNSANINLVYGPHRYEPPQNDSSLNNSCYFAIPPEFASSSHLVEVPSQGEALVEERRSSQRQRSSFTEEIREKVGKVRKDGACLRCRYQKESVGLFIL